MESDEWDERHAVLRWEVLLMLARVLAVWLALFPALAFGQSAVLNGFPPGTFQSRAALDAAPSGGVTLSLDGTPQTVHAGAGAVLVLPPFSTTLTNDVIVVATISNGFSVSSVTDTAGLTFARMPALTPPNAGSSGLADIWFAVSPSALVADVVTVNFSASAFSTALVFGVNGAHTAAPFDTSGPTTTVSGTLATLTTTASNTLGIGLAVISTPAPASGWTNMSSTAATGFLTLDTKIFSAPQSGTVFDTGGTGVSIATAIIQGP